MRVRIGLRGQDSETDYGEDFFIAFSTKPLGPRQQVKCHETIEEILSLSLVPTQLIIPHSLGGHDYDCRKFISHIRADKNNALSSLPILVILNHDDHEFNRLHQKVVYESPKGTGRHDLSNKWAPYSVMCSLCLLEPENAELTELRDEFKRVLIEELYFKKLILSLEEETEGDKSEYNLVSSFSKHRNKCLKNLPRKMLIVEDQLSDGWRNVYKRLFFNSNSSVELLFAESAEEAKNKLDQKKHADIGLVLLDVRLSAKERYGSEIPVKNLSGVKLAKEIRQKEGFQTVPIVATTASNKSWTLEELLECGVNEYWAKASPETANSLAAILRNTKSLCVKIEKCMSWSQKTGEWRKKLYAMAEKTRDALLLEKAESLQALLFQAFSPYSSKLAHGLQNNLAYITIYSCINEIGLWACNKHSVSDIKVQYDLKGLGDPVILRVKGKGDNKATWVIQNRNNEEREKYEEWRVLERILGIIQMTSGNKNFNPQLYSFKETRNRLAIIHGNDDPFVTPNKNYDVESKEIDDLVNWLEEIVDMLLYFQSQK